MPRLRRFSRSVTEFALRLPVIVQRAALHLGLHALLGASARLGREACRPAMARPGPRARAGQGGTSGPKPCPKIHRVGPLRVFPAQCAFTLLLTVAVLVADRPVRSRRARARPAQKQATAVGSGGAAATVDLDGTRAAIRTLRRGGNAVDAAVAAAGVLGVTEPFSCGIGGGGFMVIRTAKGKVTTIDGREESPRDDAARTPSWANGAPLAFNDARYSGLSAGIPGTPATWELALKRYGTWSLARALRPGIRVARDGFIVDQTFVRSDRAERPLVRRHPVHRGDLPRPGRHAARRGLDAPEPGHRAHLPAARPRGSRRLLQRASSRARWPRPRSTRPRPPTADHPWRPGLMTTDDLRRYRAIERNPTRIGYRGLDVWGMGPPSSGGSTVGEALNILEGYRASRRRPGAGAPPHARGLALHLRRPQRLPGGPGLLRRAAHRPALGQLRR